MNLNELQAFLEECNWDDDPLPAQVTDSLKSLSRKSGDGEELSFEEIELSSDFHPRATNSRQVPVTAEPAAAETETPAAEALPEVEELSEVAELSSAQEESLSEPAPAVPEESSALTQSPADALESAPVQSLALEVPPLRSAAEGMMAPAARGSAAVKLVPRRAAPSEDHVLEDSSGRSMSERLAEVEMAQRMGYLLCKCTWPPQIMVLTGTDHVYRCRRCSRVREM